jgi:hypothetical protein
MPRQSLSFEGWSSAPGVSVDPLPQMPTFCEISNVHEGFRAEVGKRASGKERRHLFSRLFSRLTFSSARQVAAAIEEVVLKHGTVPQTWADAQSRHQLLYGDRFRDLQRE